MTSVDAIFGTYKGTAKSTPSELVVPFHPPTAGPNSPDSSNPVRTALARL
ncbi:hypothetical protein ABZ656_36315 [Streptomyces sp. NPDC007095]